MMAGPEKKNFRGGVKKFFFAFLGTIRCGLRNESKKNGGAHTSLEIWALQKFGPRGLETLFCRFLRFFLLGTGVHPHPPPTTYWCQTNLKYDFWGLGTTWPHQPPKNAGWLAPWATAKGRTPWDGASALAQGGPPPVALSTSYRGVNATSFEIFGARVARNKGIGEKFHHSWSGRVRCVGAPGRQSDRTGLLDFFSHQNMQTSGNNHRKRVTPLLTIVLSICEPVFWAV